MSALAFVIGGLPPARQVGLSPASSACPPSSRVAVVGDSLSDQASDETVWTLTSAGYQVVAYDAAWLRRTSVDSTLMGHPVPSGNSIVRTIVAAADVDCWIVALGTNDVHVGDSAEYANEINDLLSSVPQSGPVFWVGVGIGEKAYPDRPGPRLRGDAFNRAVRSIAARSPHLTYVDFTAQSAQRDVLDVDGVHLRPLGRQARAQTIVDSLLAPLRVAPRPIAHRRYRRDCCFGSKAEVDAIGSMSRNNSAGFTSPAGFIRNCRLRGHLTGFRAAGASPLAG